MYKNAIYVNHEASIMEQRLTILYCRARLLQSRAGMEWNGLIHRTLPMDSESVKLEDVDGLNN
jgi:hypothetical protein